MTKNRLVVTVTVVPEGNQEGHIVDAYFSLDGKANKSITTNENQGWSLVGTPYDSNIVGTKTAPTGSDVYPVIVALSRVMTFEK